MAKILVVDDNETIREGTALALLKSGHEVLEASSGKMALEKFVNFRPKVVLTDLKMEDIDGIELLKQIKAKNTDTVVVLMTAYAAVDTAIEAIRLGAYDYLQKPFSPETLRAKIEQAIQFQDLSRKAEHLQNTHTILKNKPRTHEMLGQSTAFKNLLHKADRIAGSESHVHLYGASGTGKELLAQYIHERSSRAHGPLITINCGAIPETLFESELFGYEKGAFTGADKRKLGRFELADGGTLFLDEVAEIPLSMQVKLLRAIQEQSVDRIGGNSPISVSVRIISATHRKLEDEVRAGKFREDLFYRLHVVPLHLPSLIERSDDILPLAQSFLDEFSKRDRKHKVPILSDEAKTHLLAYNYPGNIRELRNIMEQAMVFSNLEIIQASDLPSQVTGQKREAEPENLHYSIPLPAGDLGLTDFLEAAERQLILRAYTQAGGVKTETARRLQIKTSALYYKLEKYGIGDVQKRRDPETDTEIVSDF